MRYTDGFVIDGLSVDGGIGYVRRGEGRTDKGVTIRRNGRSGKSNND